jgi:N-dimethylarginine dimethylaminohydrolase
MTLVAPSSRRSSPSVRPRRLAMCRPQFFEVAYRINPWMRPAVPVDARRATEQWEAIRDCYEALGHTVEIIDPVAGLPDLVFTANAGLVIDDTVLVSRFRHPERSGEEAVFAEWFRDQGYRPVIARSVNEGEGDHLVVGGVILAGSGFRSDPDAHREVAAVFDREVVPLRLVDERFYHLDTALAVLDDDTIAYWPGAFDERSRLVLEQRWPDAVVATEADAVAFGLNACSDGHHVVLAAGATRLADVVRARGYEPILVETTELQRSGGSVKCCTLELTR